MKTEKYTGTAVTPTAWIPEKKPNFFMKLLQYILGLFRIKCCEKDPGLEYPPTPQEFFSEMILNDEAKKERNKKLQFLHKCMMQYEKKTGIGMPKLKEKLYKFCNVKSRSDLTDEQLDAEIKYFTSI